MSDSTTIFVNASWKELAQPMIMGTLTANEQRGHITYGFKYSLDWLKQNEALFLDPDLEHHTHSQYLQQEGKPNFGIFLDSSPDRWGRDLLQYRERKAAEAENRKMNRLTDVDFLLGVFDGARSGGLRLKSNPDGEFLSNEKDMATPPITSLRALQEASLAIENNAAPGDETQAKFIRAVINAGSSLGGARPKINVLERNSTLWIAKFPSRKDSYDMGAFEYLVYSLAEQCGINIVPANKQRFANSDHTFLVKRFDRDDYGNRIHYASAMTMLGYYDGNTEGASYLEILEFLIKHSANPKEDLNQLFRRIAFSIAIANTDDHLRNHGFILTRKGWRLSPAFDINPEPYKDHLSLLIDQVDSALDFNTLLSTAPYYGIEEDAAVRIIDKVLEVTGKWEKVAQAQDISKEQIDLIKPAFSAYIPL